MNLEIHHIFQATMNSTMLYHYRISVGSSRMAYPFVCQLIPFISINKPIIKPFVGKKIPFILNKGFTLVELIVVLTIAGILAALAAPGMQKFASSNRLTTQVNDLLADVNLIRSESIKRNSATGICASTDGASCTASGNWASGWLVYYDNSGTKVVLKVHEALSGGNTLKAEQTNVGSSTTTAVDTVAYSKSGTFSSTTFTYKFTVCDPKHKQTKMLDITVVGQTSISSGTC